MKKENGAASIATLMSHHYSLISSDFIPAETDTGLIIEEMSIEISTLPLWDWAPLYHISFNFEMLSTQTAQITIHQIHLNS